MITSVHKPRGTKFAGGLSTHTWGGPSESDGGPAIGWQLIKCLHGTNGGQNWNRCLGFINQDTRTSAAFSQSMAASLCTSKPMSPMTSPNSSKPAAKSRIESPLSSSGMSNKKSSEINSNPGRNSAAPSNYPGKCLWQPGFQKIRSASPNQTSSLDNLPLPRCINRAWLFHNLSRLSVCKMHLFHRNFTRRLNSLIQFCSGLLNLQSQNQGSCKYDLLLLVYVESMHVGCVYKLCKEKSETQRFVNVSNK